MNSIKKIDKNITELEKVEKIIENCINQLYDGVSQESVAYILELANSKISSIKYKFDKINDKNS